MTIENSKLHAPHDEEDIPFAEVLPLNDPNSGAGPKLVDRSARAYAVGYKNYQADEEGVATVIKEATVLENLGWDKETRRIFIRKVYSILACQLILTFCVCAFMTLHAPTQIYVLTHTWPMVFSMISSIVLIIALMCYKDQEPTNMYLMGAFTFVEAFLVGTGEFVFCIYMV